MSDAVSELLKQAHVVLAERTPSSNRTRQALNLIAHLPRLEKDEIGRTKFAIAMSLRGLCLSFRSVSGRMRTEALACIEHGTTLLEGLNDAPQDTAYDRWLRE